MLSFPSVLEANACTDLQRIGIYTGVCERNYMDMFGILSCALHVTYIQCAVQNG
jgi:hypothetical protein